VGLRNVLGLHKQLDRKPKPMGQSRLKKQSACPQCNFVYAAANDPKADEDWIRCKKLEEVSCHDPCAERNGVLDDEGFFVDNVHNVG